MVFIKLIEVFFINIYLGTALSIDIIFKKTGTKILASEKKQYNL